MAMVDGFQAPVQIPKLPAPVKDFIPYLFKYPDTPIATLLEPYKAYESNLRKLYARKPDHEVVADGKVNLVPLFSHVSEIEIKVRARPLETETDVEKSRFSWV